MKPTDALTTMTYRKDGRIARITLDRPARGNGITFDMPRELTECVERANLDPGVPHVAVSSAHHPFSRRPHLLRILDDPIAAVPEARPICRVML